MKDTLVLMLLIAFTFSCGEAELGLDKSAVNQRFGTSDTIPVIETVDYTEAKYTFTGSDSIASLYPLFPDDFVWYGVDSDSQYPIKSQGGACDSRGNMVNTLAELPKTIEGIVTLHPRYFQKISFCGQDERFYGSYIIEDSTRGILVLKDSRIADFTYGDKVKLRVRGLVKFFDTYAVIVSDQEEVIEKANPVYFKDIGFRGLSDDDIGSNLRVTGRVAGLPNNRNFNELCLVDKDAADDSACDFSCTDNDGCSGYVLVSLDREIGQREPDFFKLGDVMEVTGPSVNSFGNKLLVARLGQLKIIKTTESN